MLCQYVMDFHSLVMEKSWSHFWKSVGTLLWPKISGRSGHPHQLLCAIR